MAKGDSSRILSDAIRGVLDSNLGAVEGPITLSYGSPTFSDSPSYTITTSGGLMDIDSSVDGSVANASGIASDWTWYGQSSGTGVTVPSATITTTPWFGDPVVIQGDPWGGQFVPQTGIISQPAAPLTPDQIIQLAEFYKSLREQGQAVDPADMKAAATKQLGHEPTQEELDDIRRQIHDRLITEEREL